MKELKLTPSAARAIVESARPETLRSVHDPDPLPPPIPLAPDIRLARLQTAWRRDESGLWRATACFVVGDVGRVDPSFEFEVVAPMARSQPYGSPKSERFYVVWRGRWESLQTPAPYIPRYVSGVATAVYTNAPWYKLVSYLGDKPYENEPVTVVVDKGDGKGWPWTAYYCPEHWSALVNEKNFGIGVYQPTSAFMTGGFAFQESDKGLPLGEKDGPTGYIAPVENTILDWNIKRTYRATFIVGSIEEIRATVYEIAKKEIPARPSWIFESDRQNWSYVDATDAGFPIVGELVINLNPNANGVAQSPTTFWKAEDAPTLVVEAAFSGDGPDAPTDGEITLTLTPVSPFDQIDSIRRQIKADARKSDPSVEDYPLLPEITKSVPVKFDGISRKLTVDLSELEGYSGAFKRLSVVLPQRAGTARIKRVEFLEK